jgi:uncharacterized membrane protein
MNSFKGFLEWVGIGIDSAGVVIIVIGALYATSIFLRNQQAEGSYRLYRQSLGRAILLGLEFLVAGDIIRTVAVAPTPTNVGVLAGIILIRTFLSAALELEIEGRWPWEKAGGVEKKGPYAQTP